ncbi:galactokinase [Alphaproteobacteria bacterium]|jgi:galactokinase|nr:galactokinase [Alphaproteobacteria bacterium]
MKQITPEKEITPDEIENIFNAEYSGVPDACGFAHGRANLIGDHTDYNDGFVMPVLLGCKTQVAVGFRDDDQICGRSDAFPTQQRPLDAPCDGSWLDFISGALSVLRPFGGALCGVNVMVRSDVPSGAGVSSSAALELALLRALMTAQQLAPIEAGDLARAAQRIEHDFIGTQCGIMDQMVCAAAQPGEAMLLDCRSLTFECLPLFAGHSFVVIHSGSSRKLSEGLYNARLAECQHAAKTLSVPMLRDAVLQDISADMDQTTQARARHVIGENQRVIDASHALRLADVGRFGALMTASHVSLRDDYEVSSPHLDNLVQAVLDAGALGARLTGAGFGGCCVALCETPQIDTLVNAAATRCPQSYLVDCVTA